MALYLKSKIYIPISLQIALCFIKGSRSGRTFLISTISIICISLGVTILIIGLSIINGFEKELNNRILSIIPHIEVKSVDEYFSNYEELINYIKSVKDICCAVPQLNFNSIIEYNGKMKVVQVKGIDPSINDQVSLFSKYIDSNCWIDFHNRGNKIIIGKGISDKLNIRIGDLISIIIPNSKLDTCLLQADRFYLRVSGILNLNGQFDHTIALIHILDAQRYLYANKSVNCIATKVSNGFDYKKISYIIETICRNVKASFRSWTDTYEYMSQDIKIMRAILYLLTFLIISISYFSIVSTLIMIIKSKNSDIFILRAIGSQDRLLYFIFIWCSLIIGMIGWLIGTILGIIMSEFLLFIIIINVDTILK